MAIKLNSNLKFIEKVILFLVHILKNSSLQYFVDASLTSEQELSVSPKLFFINKHWNQYLIHLST